VVDFSGHINDQAFEGGSAEDVEIDIGAQRFLPDLERSLVGRRPGEVYSVEIEFPADYTA
jgi:trigger factor